MFGSKIREKLIVSSNKSSKTSVLTLKKIISFAITWNLDFMAAQG